jgi:hypothetical protein
MIPLSFMKPSSGPVPYRLELQSIDQLLPGREAGLDVICDGIFDGTEFIYCAEENSSEGDLNVLEAAS